MEQRIDQQHGLLRHVLQQGIHRHAQPVSRGVQHLHAGKLDAHQPGNQVAVRKDRAFDPARGSGGEQDGAGIVGFCRARVFGGNMAAPFYLRFVEGAGQVQHPPGIAALADQAGAFAVGQHEFGRHFVDHADQFGGRSPAVEQGGNAAGLDHGHEGDDPFRAVAHADGDAFTTVDLQQWHQPVAQGKDFGKGQAAMRTVIGFLDDEGRVAMPPRRFDHGVEVCRGAQELAQAIHLADLEGGARRGQGEEVGVKAGHAASFAMSLAQR